MMNYKTKDGHTVSDGDYVWEVTIVNDPKPRYQPVLSIVGKDLKSKKLFWKDFIPCNSHCHTLNVKSKNRRK